VRALGGRQPQLLLLLLLLLLLSWLPYCWL
jgi:hypothetical protein